MARMRRVCRAWKSGSSGGGEEVEEEEGEEEDEEEEDEEELEADTTREATPLDRKKPPLRGAFTEAARSL